MSQRDEINELLSEIFVYEGDFHGFLYIDIRGDDVRKMRDEIVDIIIARERKMLEEIEKPLRDKASLCLLLTRLRCLSKESKDDLLSIFNAIDEALTKIQEMKGMV